MAPRTPNRRLTAVVAAAVLFAVIAAVYLVGHSGNGSGAGSGAATAPHNPDSIDLSDSQLSEVKVEPVEERDFPVEKEAVGSIDFNEDMEVQVFTPYQGKIIALFAKVGDDVKKGQTLFTIDSPDLLQAESTLIAAAGVLDLDSKNLDRLRELYTTRAVSQHDVEQAASDQQTAEGNLRAARDAVRIFGKTDADIDRIVADRIADPTLVVPNPIDGRITARNAAPGLFVQPGSAPAPYTVADIDTMWMLANVAEDDSPAFQVGQQLEVTRRCVSRSGLRRQDHHHQRQRRSKYAARIGAVRDQGSAARIALGHVRQFRHPCRQSGALARRTGRRRGARRRRHDDDLGNRRPPALHQADGQDRRGARRLPANSGWRAGRRAGGDRGSAIPEQCAGHGLAMRVRRAEAARDAAAGRQPC